MTLRVSALQLHSREPSDPPTGIDRVRFSYSVNTSLVCKPPVRTRLRRDNQSGDPLALHHDLLPGPPKLAAISKDPNSGGRRARSSCRDSSGAGPDAMSSVGTASVCSPAKLVLVTFGDGHELGSPSVGRCFCPFEGQHILGPAFGRGNWQLWCEGTLSQLCQGTKSLAGVAIRATAFLIILSRLAQNQNTTLDGTRCRTQFPECR